MVETETRNIPLILIGLVAAFALFLALVAYGQPQVLMTWVSGDFNLSDQNFGDGNFYDLHVDNNISADGNISAGGYFIGNGSLLTNLPAGGNPFDQNLNTTNNVSFKDINADGNATFGRTTGADLNYAWIDGNGFMHTTQSGNIKEAAYGFSGTDKNTGMYLYTAGTLGFLAQGQQLFICSKFSCTVIMPFAFASGITVGNSVGVNWDVNITRGQSTKGMSLFGDKNTWIDQNGNASFGGDVNMKRDMNIGDNNLWIGGSFNMMDTGGTMRNCTLTAGVISCT